MSWHISLVSCGAYRSYRLIRVREQLAALARGTSLVALCTFAWLFADGWTATVEPPSIVTHVLFFWVLTLSGILMTRVVARLLMRVMRRRGRNLRNVLIVGSNRRALALADRLTENSAYGYRLAGFVDDSWHAEDAPEHHKKKLLCNTDELRELLRNMAIDEVIIALPIASSYELTKRIILWCRQQGIIVRYEATLFDSFKLGSVPCGVGVATITLHDGTPDYWSGRAKRMIDLLISVTAIAMLMPAFAVVAIAIKLTSPGPVLFSQERMGFGKRRFRIVKFRTMVVGAEALMAQVEYLNESAGPTFKLSKDPRITLVGAFLRKTSLDELPQLFNVLLGEMSIVGPRPLPMRDYQGFSQDWHRRRFSVKPGITCLWQVNGRSSVGFERWMELDMDYIDSWSLFLDFKIMLKTIPAVIRGSGAM